MPTVFKAWHYAGHYWLSFLMGTVLILDRQGKFITYVVTFVDKFGTAMTLVKSDIGGNISVRCLLSSNFHVWYMIRFT